MPFDKRTEKQIKNLGKRIRQLREEQGYTSHEQFAYDHEISRSQYGRYEKGSDLQFTSLLKLAKAFKISLRDFFSEGFE